MSVLKRRMFQGGGEASNFDNYNPANLGRGSGLGTLFNVSSAVSSEFFTDENGTVFYIEKDADGNKIKEEAVDLTLSPTRNPAEAYGKQKNREKLGTLQDLGLAATGVAGATRVLGPKVLNYLSKKIGPKLPSFFAREPVIEVGKYGTAREFAPRVTGLTDFGKGTLYTAGGAGAYGAVEAVKPKSVDFTGELKDLENEGKEKPDGKKDSQAEEKPGKVPIGVVPQTLVSKVISSPDFNRFLSNLSSSLTATGSIAQGGAQAGSESFEEKLEGQKAGTGLDPKDAKTNAEFNSQLSSSINSFDKTELDIGRIEYAINLLENEGGTGLAGFFGNLLDRAAALVGKDGKEFKDQSPRTQIDSILNAIRQENIRALLGESGRTISNLDREIVAEIFGSITIDSPKAVLIEKLNQVVTKFRRDLNKHKGEVAGGVNYFVETGQNSPIAFRGNTIAAPIKRILSINNVFDYQVPEYIPGEDRLITNSSDGPITDVEYVEGT